MANKHEIEIKVRAEHTESLRDFLAQNAEACGTTRQIDTYFNHPSRSFIAEKPIREWLRLRDAEGKASLNHKLWHYKEDGTSDHCTEHETEVIDPEAAHQLLTGLGFETLVVVDKVRTAWKYLRYEIAIDAVKNLGEFIEVEYIGDPTDTNPSILAEEMLAFLRERGCGVLTRDYRGYPYDLLFPEEG